MEQIVAANLWDASKLRNVISTLTVPDEFKPFEARMEKNHDASRGLSELEGRPRSLVRFRPPVEAKPCTETSPPPNGTSKITKSHRALSLYEQSYLRGSEHEI